MRQLAVVKTMPFYIWFFRAETEKRRRELSTLGCWIGNILIPKSLAAVATSHLVNQVKMIVGCQVGCGLSIVGQLYFLTRCITSYSPLFSRISFSFSVGKIVAVISLASFLTHQSLQLIFFQDGNYTFRNLDIPILLKFTQHSNHTFLCRSNQAR